LHAAHHTWPCRRDGQGVEVDKGVAIRGCQRAIWGSTKTVVKIAPIPGSKQAPSLRLGVTHVNHHQASASV
jgi:hypothetical protein